MCSMSSHPNPVKGPCNMFTFNTKKLQCHLRVSESPIVEGIENSGQNKVYVKEDMILTSPVEDDN